MDTAHLAQALQDGLKLEHDGKVIHVRQKLLGKMVLPSGKIIACDPIAYPATPPFSVTLPPGHYPVFASVAEFTDPVDHRVAYAILRLSEQEPLRWEVAIQVRPEGYKGFPPTGYPVDAGTGCFMDESAASVLLQRFQENPDYHEAFLDEYLADPEIPNLNLILDPATGANCIQFSSGWGDGYYFSYWGYNQRNQITCLVTDFRVLPQ